MLKKILASLLILVVVSGLGFVDWASATNPIQAEAAAALQSDALVQVTNGQSATKWLVFQPTGQQPDTGLVFYPGGKVDYRAYAPYAHALAARGYLVVIVHMPLNLAVFNSDAAAKVISASPQAFPNVKHWAVGGHSLGGAMAAHYAARHLDQVQGLVLLASYPANSDSLVKSGIRVLSIYGTNDGLATGDKIDAARPLLPQDTWYVAIAGGNHGQFGYYGIQSGDRPATISRADQQAQAVAATDGLLRSLSEK